MFQARQHFQKFYHSREGWIVRKILKSNIERFTTSTPKNQMGVGIGYTAPYLNIIEKYCETLVALSPNALGEYNWPKQDKNKNASVITTELPIESNSLDIVLAVHFLEFCEYPDYALKELWRVLKGGGEVILVVPNRMSMWSRRDWSPLGHGQPYSASQLVHMIESAQFEILEESTSLYAFPIRWKFFTKTAWSFEKFGQLLFPSMGGMHVLKLKKKVYATRPEKGLKVGVKNLSPKSVATSSRNYRGSK